MADWLPDCKGIECLLIRLESDEVVSCQTLEPIGQLSRNGSEAFVHNDEVKELLFDGEINFRFDFDVCSFEEIDPRETEQAMEWRWWTHCRSCTFTDR